MKGFDARFQDLPGYILGVTEEIWEGGDIDAIRRYYSDDAVVRSPGGIVLGSDRVIAATKATLAEFPDRQLLGEDVIWSGTPEAGMLSSHRILSTATHRGDGVYGQASGTQLVYRVIADCHVISNRVDDEWLVRDQAAIVRQLGQAPEDYVRQQIAAEGGPGQAAPPFTSELDVPGPYLGHGNDDPAGQRYADLLSRIMTGDAAVTSGYDRACQLEHPAGVTAHGCAAAERMWLQLRASFPDARFVIHHQIGMREEGMPHRAALRWSLEGRHAGPGAFGAPSGADVHVMGISHAEFGPWGLRREYVLYDETAVWKQIILHKGDD